MAFKFKSERGEASELKPSVETADGNERESTVISIIQNALEQINHALGGHLTFSAQGHIHPSAGRPGDNLNIQVSSLLPPAAPVQDTGLAPAGGSPRNFPPESSTAAPQTSDGSPPAAQQPIPQPDPNAQPPAPVVAPPAAGDSSEVPVTPAEDEAHTGGEAPVLPPPPQFAPPAGS